MMHLNDQPAFAICTSIAAGLTSVPLHIHVQYINSKHHADMAMATPIFPFSQQEVPVVTDYVVMGSPPSVLILQPTAFGM